MKLLIGLDVGTSAIKGVLCAPDGRLLADGQRSVAFIRPREGFAEIDPEDHYRSVCELVRELASRCPNGDSVAALGMACASGNTLLLGADGTPLGTIISWLDRRAAGRMGELLPGFDLSTVYRVVGWQGFDGFPLAHLAWLRRERPDAYGKASRVVMNIDWLTWRLTGAWSMDHSNATPFYLQDQVGRKWHQPFLELLGIREGALSTLRPSGSVVGPLTPRAAADTGLSEETVLVLGAFDHPCAARATGALQEGDLLLSCGTSWVGFYPCTDRDLLLSQQMLVDPFLSPQGPWAGMFALTAIGVSVEWLIEHLVLRSDADRADRYGAFNAAAARAPRGAGGLSINPYHDEAYFAARAAALGAARGPREIARGVMEGTAFEMKRKIDSLARAGLTPRRIHMVGGPSRSPVWPAILAEVTGLEIEIVHGQVAGAVGAAALAGIGAGIFKDEREAARALAAKPVRITPSRAGIREYAKLYEGYREFLSTES
jgi:sugar (pentulose or hexulose) kinase